MKVREMGTLLDLWTFPLGTARGHTALNMAVEHGSGRRESSVGRVDVRTAIWLVTGLVSPVTCRKLWRALKLSNQTVATLTKMGIASASGACQTWWFLRETDLPWATGCDFRHVHISAMVAEFHHLAVQKDHRSEFSEVSACEVGNFKVTDFWQWPTLSLSNLIGQPSPCAFPRSLRAFAFHFWWSNDCSTAVKCPRGSISLFGCEIPAGRSGAEIQVCQRRQEPDLGLRTVDIELVRQRKKKVHKMLPACCLSRQRAASMLEGRATCWRHVGVIWGKRPFC